jgi:hypothetical protein
VEFLSRNPGNRWEIETPLPLQIRGLENSFKLLFGRRVVRDILGYLRLAK